ncbi:N, N'-diacetylbacillosaminyl-diphospho-undecaprenol alpha-1,3-N-acetylgalactosaminyltransferase [bacterium HR11]|nr:N, N'-diacetylbacillosaminyl-diphospho-undecaprenol alpha-1,3-N-acetylgalactosaminyltransferase [bacterium HR11]
MPSCAPKVLLVANWDWVIYNFRLPLARALRAHGYEVVLVFPFGKFLERIRAEGFRCIPWSLDRGSLNPLQDGRALWQLVRIYQEERPHIVHHFTIKPNLYGSLAARWGSLNHRGSIRPTAINTFEGLGFMFSDHLKARLLRWGLIPFLRYALHRPNTWTVFLNEQDRAFFLRRGWVPAHRSTVIVSTGVDIQRFRPAGGGPVGKGSEGPLTVLMAGRLLWDKGVGEFVQAARILRQKGLRVRLRLIGSPDPGNPACVPEAQVRAWAREGLIEWLGHREDMPELLREAHVAVLPSYHEGVPRFLLEAAATGLPLVATDIEGCRAVVRPGENGFLVPVRDAQALAEAIERLAQDPALREQMGRASRAIAIQEFDEQKILAQWLTLYQQIRTEVGTS